MSTSRAVKAKRTKGDTLEDQSSLIIRHCFREFRHKQTKLSTVAKQKLSLKGHRLVATYMSRGISHRQQYVTHRRLVFCLVEPHTQAVVLGMYS